MSEVRTGLLRAAVEEIGENGLAKASLRAIARRCGVSHQASAHHFADRAGLFTALAADGFERMLARTRDDVEAARASGQDPVAAMGVAYLRYADAEPTTFDVMSRAELLHPEDDQLVTARLAMWDYTLDIVRTAQRERGWGAGVPAEKLNMACWSTVHGLALIRRDLLATLPTLHAIDAEDVVRLVTAAIESTP
ncbi:TetR/AcrR family transcriptional regulator [Nocardioides sp. R-C-SC26]|uniref:TetR/AcrR family transcriptional regulator n=1 Tax=Nocardioides sp. R-C-SC26 TaxID=2870414 RepID=UPI001E574FE1|nr:TetR/AcrR family transcriptional regulator [Nocardioides sp. R-C-SC26]